jgi:hypothetical protein
MDNRVILTGRIDIPDNIILIRELLNSLADSTVIINLDEDNKLEGNIVIQGTMLLPPPEAIIAEQDGDEYSYDTILNEYYNIPDMQMFVTGIINMLYRGNNILFYYPDLNPTESITIPKLLNLFWNKFGLGIGIIGIRECSYNYANIPMWLNMLYSVDAISAYEYLSKYPNDAKILDSFMSKLIGDIRPIDEGSENKINTIYRLRKMLHEKPTVREAFVKM